MEDHSSYPDFLKLMEKAFTTANAYKSEFEEFKDMNGWSENEIFIWNEIFG